MFGFSGRVVSFFSCLRELVEVVPISSSHLWIPSSLCPLGFGPPLGAFPRVRFPITIVNILAPNRTHESDSVATVLCDCRYTIVLTYH